MSDVNRCVSGHLLDIIMRRQGLAAHLDAIKRFLLLGQGDFVQSLLDLVEQELDKPAKEVSQYTLQVCAEGGCPCNQRRPVLPGVG